MRELKTIILLCILCAFPALAFSQEHAFMLIEKNYTDGEPIKDWSLNTIEKCGSFVPAVPRVSLSFVGVSEGIDDRTQLRRLEKNAQKLNRASERLIQSFVEYECLSGLSSWKTWYFNYLNSYSSTPMPNFVCTVEPRSDLGTIVGTVADSIPDLFPYKEFFDGEVLVFDFWVEYYRMILERESDLQDAISCLQSTLEYMEARIPLLEVSVYGY